MSAKREPRPHIILSMSTVLARFIQISDLHFKVPASDDQRTTSGGRDQDQPANGFRVANSYALCRALAAFVNRHAAANPHEPPIVLITGDLTNCGSHAEMDLVRQYLDGGASFGNHVPVGLAPTEWRRYAVLGNHDHWAGQMWPAHPAPNTPKCGLLWPSVHATVPLNAGGDGAPRKYIRFIGIDTDADTGRAQRAFALGAFCSQLEKLRRHPALAASRPPGEIRVLCMHHALYYERTPYLSILPPSRKMLREFLADYEISVILSGHIHETVFANIRSRDRTPCWRTLESSCGTTTRDIRPFRRAMKSFGVAYMNQLVVHTVEESGGRLTWRAEDHHYREGRGFVSSVIPGGERRGWSEIDLP
jgi:3',5'-cyclic AMP phosphodiesterase CpdA